MIGLVGVGECSLTLEAVAAHTLVLILCVGEAGALVEARPALTRAAITTLGNAPVLRETVGQVHLLRIDQYLHSQTNLLSHRLHTHTHTCVHTLTTNILYVCDAFSQRAHS